MHRPADEPLPPDSALAEVLEIDFVREADVKPPRLAAGRPEMRVRLDADFSRYRPFERTYRVAWDAGPMGLLYVVEDGTLPDENPSPA